ncbi:unnamed protein product [Eruca vesicaria subsp. sativa]|uniref:Disease resistance protein n=1 Tax=Eruca vesicaria subsp. sativa TaxID=29727 RepID=A0ABC8LPW4_ERUVS|nr:unnamed protein product [Eruca vesicaria subsp. sativa]
MGIRFDLSTIEDIMNISPRAFKRMCNLRFLKIYNTRLDTNVRVHVPEDMYFPPRLKLLHWEEYPGKCLPHTFWPENLVELNLEYSNLRHLWKGAQPLGNLRKLNLSASSNLEELPNLANATNLEILDVSDCENLVKIHSSVGRLHKLEKLEMEFCRNLQVVPTLFNLESLHSVLIGGCNQLRKLPNISTTVTYLSIVDTMLEEFTASIRLWSHLEDLCIVGGLIPDRCTTQTHLVNLMVERSGADIERIPDCIKDLHNLDTLWIIGCPKLASLPELPRSLKCLMVWNCESLETIVPFRSDSEISNLYFANCFKLGPEARREITKQSLFACIPGRDIPAEFNHKAIGNSLAIISSNASRFKMCVIISPKSEMEDAFNDIELMCCISINGCSKVNCPFLLPYRFQSEHLGIFYHDIPKEDFDFDVEILFEFSSVSQDLEIIECGVQILVVETDSKQLLDYDDRILSNESFELDESRVETVDDLDERIEYDASRVETDDGLFAPTFFSFGF